MTADDGGSVTVKAVSVGNTRGSPHSNIRADGVEGPQPQASTDTDRDGGSATAGRVSDLTTDLLAQQDRGARTLWAVCGLAAPRAQQHVPRVRLTMEHWHARSGCLAQAKSDAPHKAKGSNGIPIAPAVNDNSVTHRTVRSSTDRRWGVGNRRMSRASVTAPSIAAGTELESA